MLHGHVTMLHGHRYISFNNFIKIESEWHKISRKMYGINTNYVKPINNMYSIISIELCWNVTLCAPTSRNYPHVSKLSHKIKHWPLLNLHVYNFGCVVIVWCPPLPFSQQVWHGNPKIIKHHFEVKISFKYFRKGIKCYIQALIHKL